MKIAAVSDNGTTVSQHFGRAQLYVVFTIEEGKIISKENRDKVGHHTFASSHPSEPEPVESQGCSGGAPLKHAAMGESIGDCQVVIAGGMGWGAFDSLTGRGIETVVTGVQDIDEAIKLYLDSKLPNLMERLH
jgi:predicted Fe-Mo cluster-binding NifX family protein